MAEAYYSQTAYRYGDYVAKLGFVPTAPTLAELEKLPFDPQTPDALREGTVRYFKTHGARFDVVVQLSTDPEKMPVEDPVVAWSEEASPYRTVAQIVISPQDAFDPARANIVEGDFSFSPAHTLMAHRPLGGINRMRLAAYTAISTLRRQENARPIDEPTSIEQVPA